MAAKKTKKSTFTVSGESAVEKVKEILKEGNVRKITIKSKDGKTIASFPLTIGVVGVLIAPVIAAVAAIVALIGECSITVEKEA